MQYLAQEKIWEFTYYANGTTSTTGSSQLNNTQFLDMSITDKQNVAVLNNTFSQFSLYLPMQVYNTTHTKDLSNNFLFEAKSKLTMNLTDTGYVFNTTNNNYLFSENATTLDSIKKIGSPYLISFIFKANQLKNQAIIDNAPVSLTYGTKGYRVSLGSLGSLRFSYMDTSDTPCSFSTANNFYVANKNYHIVFYINNTGVTLYLNGQWYSNKTCNNPIATSGNNFTIGNNRINSLQYDGIIDEIYLINYSLTKKQAEKYISQLYNVGCSKGYCVNFINNSGESITTNFLKNTNLSINPATFIFSVKPQNTNDSVILFGGNESGKQFYVGISGGYWDFGIGNKNFGGKSYTQGASTSLTQLAFVINASNASLYVNGLQKLSVGLNTSFKIPKNLSFGRMQGGQYYYSGSLDEIKFYNSSLSAKTIYGIYKNFSNLSVINNGTYYVNYTYRNNTANWQNKTSQKAYVFDADYLKTLIKADNCTGKTSHYTYDVLNYRSYMEDISTKNLNVTSAIYGYLYIDGYPDSLVNFTVNTIQRFNTSLCFKYNYTYFGTIYNKYSYNQQIFTKYIIPNTSFSNSNIRRIFIYNHMNNSLTTPIEIIVHRNDNGLFYTNIITVLQRLYFDNGLVWRNVQMDTTDNFGKSYYNVETYNVDYRIQYINLFTGVVIDTSAPTRFGCADTFCTYNSYLDVLSNSQTQSNVNANYVYSSSNKQLKMMWNDPTTITNKVTLKVYKPLLSGTSTICETSQLGSSGNINCSLVGQEGEIAIQVYDSTSVNKSVAFFWLPINITPFADIFVNNNQEGDSNFFAYAILTTLVIGVAAVGNIVAAIIVLVGGLFALSAFGITNLLSISIVTIIAVIGLIIAHKMR